MGLRHPVRLVCVGEDEQGPPKLMLEGVLEENTTADDLIIAWRTRRLRIERGRPVMTETPSPLLDDADPGDEVEE